MNSIALKRSTSERFEREPFYVGSVLVEPMLLRVTKPNGGVTELSMRQIKALALLAHKYGEVVSRNQIHGVLCLSEEGQRDRGALSQHIKIIRRAFGDSSKDSRYIKTVRLQGYYLLIEPVFAESPKSSSIQPEMRNNAATGSGWLSQYLSVPWRSLTNDRRLVIKLATFSFCITFILSAFTLFEASIANQSQSNENAEAALSRNNYSHELENSKGDTEFLRKKLQTILSDSQISGSVKASLLLAVGDRFMLLNDWEFSQRALKASLILQRRQPDAAKSLQLAWTLTKLAQVKSVDARDIDDSRELLLEAAQLIREQPQTVLEHARILGIHAGLFEFDNDLAGTESLLRKSISIASEKVQSHDPFLLNLQTRLAKNLTLQSNFIQAQELTQTVLLEAQSNFSEESIELLPILNQSAFLASKQGYHREAVRRYKKVLSILKDRSFYQYDEALHARHSLAKSLLAAGEGESSIATYLNLINDLNLRNPPANPLALANLRLGLSDALIEVKRPMDAYQEIQKTSTILEDQSRVPDWLHYSLNSLHGAVLIELGNCSKGLQLINDTVDQMFLDKVTDPRISSQVYARKNHYSSGHCAVTSGKLMTNHGFNNTRTSNTTTGIQVLHQFSKSIPDISKAIVTRISFK